LRGHIGWVHSVSYSPDGTRLASASYDNTVKVWDATSGAQLATLRGHTDIVTAVSYSPDGRRLVSTDLSGRTLVWDAATGKPLPGPPPSPSLRADNVSPDGATVAVPVGSDIRLWPRRPPPGGYDPWAEDLYRRMALAPAWHADEAEHAEQRGDWFAAAFHRRRLAQLRPDEPEHRLDLVRALWQRGHWREALEFCGRVVARHPQLAPAYLDRARLRLACGDRPGADTDSLTALALAATARTDWPAFARREAQAGDAAAVRWDWGGARQHLGLAVLWQPGEPEHLRRLAWAELAAGDAAACRRTLCRLHQRQRGGDDRAPLFHLSASLAAGPSPGLLAAPAVVEVVLRREAERRAAVLARAATLLPDSGLERAGLLAPARGAARADPQGWQAREVLGAALYRAGKPEEAVRELDEAVRLHGALGSSWARLFLALAHQRLGHADKVQEFRVPTTFASGWEEQLVRQQLEGELDSARRPGGR
jgi:tetratricopeptide (TPR) repeat protein